MSAAVYIGPDREPVEVSEVSITRSLENAVSGLRFSTFEQRQASLGAPVRAEFLGLPLFHGTVEAWPGSPEAGYNVTARSQTVNLQLVEALANERPRQTTVQAIAAELCQRVGVELAPSGEDVPVDRFRLERSTSYQRAIQALCECRGFVLTDDADGRAVLYRVPSDRTPVEVWEEGHEPVRSIEIMLSIRDWRDEIVCRGARSPMPADVDDPGLSQVTAAVVAANTRISRRVLSNRSARSSAAAAVLVADEARKALASAIEVGVTLSDTARVPGDIVLVRKRTGGFRQAMIVSSMTWTATPQDIAVEASCVPIAVYDSTGDIFADIAQGVAR